MLKERYTYEEGLESARLITRFLTKADISWWADFFKDKEAVELFPDFGLDTPYERAEHWVDKQLLRYEDNRLGMQVLIEKKSNQPIGQSGLTVQEIDGIPEIEVGYHIFKQYWGQGFAPEAAKLFINYAFQNNLTDSIISIIDKRNIKSQRVADKNGLIREKESTWNGLDVFIYRMNKEDWM